jgi:hypothetical protein
VGDPDPADDTSIYSSCYRYRIDYGKTPGKNWTEEAITVDPKRYPHDPRLQDMWIFTRVVRWKGQRIMYGRRQIGPETWFWRFDGEIAVPAAMYYPHGARKGAWPPDHPDGPFLWVDANGDGTIQAEEYQKVAVRRGNNGICVDDAGDIWLSDYYVKDGPSMTRIPFGGLNKSGAPTWDLSKASVVPVPTVAGDQLICKWNYDPARDRMYLGMFTEKRPHPTWPRANAWEQCSVGPVIRCWGDWSKKPRLLWETDKNGFEGSKGPGGKPVTQHKAWSVEGDHLFAAYTRLQEQIAVDVYQTSDGKFLGTLLPSEEIGPTGWVDGNDAVQAHRRSDGTYVILVEECWMGKNLVFLWRPGGGGTGTTPARPPGRRN